ncbi:N-acetyltransferase [Celerinatantimonas sp. YJH-8]|uniref:N-acetyltransferase n=1 Tax=Celerinatantimonas sp. YJH-8 TaxID=3228714 RepID=UPI0038C150D8
MIRKYQENDLACVLQLWLNASIIAHDFIAAEFWESQVDAMRHVYIPASESYVFEMKNEVVGFYALNENHLAALFVAPEWQGQGIGTQLLAHATHRSETLTLSVYKENQASYQFYVSHGFKVVREQRDIHTGHLEYRMCLER